MSTTLPTNRHSPHVVLSLLVGDRTFSLSQVAPDFVILSEEIELSPCRTEVQVNVDGHVHSRHVQLVDGIQPSIPRTRVQVFQSEQ